MISEWSVWGLKTPEGPVVEPYIPVSTQEPCKAGPAHLKSRVPQSLSLLVMDINAKDAI